MGEDEVGSNEDRPPRQERDGTYVDPSIEAARTARRGDGEVSALGGMVHDASGCLSEAGGCLGAVIEIIASFFRGF